MSDLTAHSGATIAFDLDGTLVESAPDLIGAVNAILIAEGFEPLAYNEGPPSSAVVPTGCCNGVLRSPESKKQTPVPLAALVGRFISYYSAHIADESLPFPG
ncbi:phosphoglycolate phosphatase [Rhizobium tibeticum]|uniref:hypothetical protein n=1 Tax=Rhizobium tibeticum TaxID=501024 RepID=UPI0027835444|nr:hypothetical protein [Rhizobium tibeticum]MDP9813912.1 phosphoglycolate phosphatase [Rhizobium tibeticum]